MAFYDYYAGGDLRSITRPGGATISSTLKHVFLQVSEALAFLHYGFTEPGVPPPRGWRHVVHCDLKVRTFLLA